ncbi:MAG: flavodoxin [Spirochaetes bacterium]|nr:flavodoxin [Spirochaetota bacterium]
MKKIAILYGSTTGNTENAAKQIAEKIGKEQVTLFNVSGFSASDLNEYDILLLGTSTWGMGDLQDDWDSFLPVLKESNLQGKYIGLFGLGDSSGYDISFVDGMGTIYEQLENSCAKFIGSCDSDEYDFISSKALINGRFVGLALDKDNESDKTAGRISSWIESIKEFFE